MRRLALLIFGGAVFLLLAAVPVLADGGPHVATVNSGTTGISADSCAGCHRAHTAKGEMLLVQDVPALCLTCHGETGTGATTDVMDGIQYAVAGDPSQVRGTAVLGALRSGGFAKARIDSGQRGAARLSVRNGRPRARSSTGAWSRARTSPRRTWTSAIRHAGTAWGQGSSGAGSALTITCTSCHNPHGNGQYRILNPIPGDGTGPFAEAATARHRDGCAAPSPGDAATTPSSRRRARRATISSYLLYASQLGPYTRNDGRLLPPEGSVERHKRVPSTRRTERPALHVQRPDQRVVQSVPHALSGENVTYPAGTGPYNTPTGDPIFTYRHSNSSDKPCTTCHVAHGSNAVMIGVYSSTETMPDGTTAAVGDSRLLKIDNRGTCQACHDPTGTITAGTQIGTPPVVP